MPESSRRHRWIRLRVHVYICERCGCGRENERIHGGWRQRFHTSDGLSAVRPGVPPCIEGTHTDRYLKKHESAIGVGGLKKERQQEHVTG